MPCPSLQHLRPGKLTACVVILPSYRVCNCIAYSSPVECRPPCLTWARALYELYSYYVISGTDVLQNAALHPMKGTRAPFFSPCSKFCTFFFGSGQLHKGGKIWHLGVAPVEFRACRVRCYSPEHLTSPQWQDLCWHDDQPQLKIFCLVQPSDSSIPSHISPLPELLSPW